LPGDQRKEVAAGVAVLVGCGGGDSACFSPAPTVTDIVTAGPVVTSAAASEPSPTVMALQSAMEMAGFCKGELSGVYDDATVAVVNAFRSPVGLPAGGIVGPDTLTIIEMDVKALNGG
jgi:peptidoglycan hydrolase-like protein with peptidoglycan-binding domain